MVGVLLLAIDSAVLMLWMEGLGLGPYGGRCVSYLIAASCGWFINRAFTFGGQVAGGSKRGEWLRYLLVNLGGFAINYGTYAALIAHFALTGKAVLWGVAGGAVAGVGFNFVASRHLVYRIHKAKTGA